MVNFSGVGSAVIKSGLRTIAIGTAVGTGVGVAFTLPKRLQEIRQGDVFSPLYTPTPRLTGNQP